MEVKHAGDVERGRNGRGQQDNCGLACRQARCANGQLLYEESCLSFDWRIEYSQVDNKYGVSERNGKVISSNNVLG